MPDEDTHYLKSELDELVRSDPRIFEFLQKGSLDGLWYWDLEKPENEWMSPEMWRLFGVEPESKTHDPSEWQDIINQDDLALALDNFHKHCADPTHPYDQIVRYRHTDGSTVWVRCRGIAIRDENGTPVRMLGAHNDVTEIKGAEETARQAAEDTRIANAELKQVVAKLARSNRELDQFAYAATHDLREPLRGVAINAEFLAQEDLSERGRERVERMMALTRRMDELLSNLFDILKLGRSNEPVEDLDPESIIRSDVNELSEWINGRNGSVTIKGELPWLTAERPKIRTVFQNLIVNGLKYNDKAEKTVEIEFHEMVEVNRRQLHNVFSIRDNGIGIAEENRSRIFQIFKRLNPDDAYGPGTGAGLAFVEKIVLEYGGIITFTSSAGVGTTFYVSLPVRKQA